MQSVENLALMRAIDEQYLRTPFYGSRKLSEVLGVNRKRIQRLMRTMGLRGATRAKKRFTTRSDPCHVRAPDLVKRKFAADRPDRLWVADFERHEALPNSAVVKGHRRVLVAAGALKLRAA